MRELSTGRKYNTHNDRLSNPLFSGKKGEPEPEPEHEPNENPEENLKEPEEDAEPIGDPEEALMGTRSGRVVRPRRNKDFDYTGVLLQPRFTRTLTQTCFSDCSYSSTSVYSFSNLDSFFEPLSIITDFAHAPLRGHANTGTMPLVQESLRLLEQRIRCEQRARLVNLGEKVYYVTDEEGVQQQIVLLKSNGTLFQLDITLGDWLTLDGTTLTEIQTSPMWPYTAGNRPITDEQVALPSFVRDMPDDYMHPRYGFTKSVAQIREGTVPVQLKPLQVQAAQDRTWEDQTWRCLHPQSH